MSAQCGWFRVMSLYWANQSESKKSVHADLKCKRLRPNSLWTTASYCQLALVPVSHPIHATAPSWVSNSAHQCCKNVAGGCSIATTKLLEYRSRDLIAAATSLPSTLAYPGFCILQASCMHIQSISSIQSQSLCCLELLDRPSCCLDRRQSLHQSCLVPEELLGHLLVLYQYHVLRYESITIARRDDKSFQAFACPSTVQFLHSFDDTLLVPMHGSTACIYPIQNIGMDLQVAHSLTKRGKGFCCLPHRSPSSTWKQHLLIFHTFRIAAATSLPSMLPRNLHLKAVELHAEFGVKRPPSLPRLHSLYATLPLPFFCFIMAPYKANFWELRHLLSPPCNIYTP